MKLNPHSVDHSAREPNDTVKHGSTISLPCISWRYTHALRFCSYQSSGWFSCYVRALSCPRLFGPNNISTNPQVAVTEWGQPAFPSSADLLNFSPLHPCMHRSSSPNFLYETCFPVECLFTARDFPSFTFCFFSSLALVSFDPNKSQFRKPYPCSANQG